MGKALKSNQAALFLQPDGANTALVFLGCHNVGDIVQPLRSLTPVRCRTADGKGWTTVAELEAPPGNVTTSLDTLLGAQRDYIERLVTNYCPANLFVMHYACGPINQINGYTRGEVLHLLRPTQRTFSSMVTSDEQQASKVAVDIEAEELLDADEMKFGKLYTADIHALNDIWANSDATCNTDCDVAAAAGKTQYAVADSAVGPAKGKAYKSVNSGETWAALAVDPGGAGLNLMGIKRIVTGTNTYRVLIAQEALGGDQGTIYFSDDDGATYTTATLGGAAAGHGIIKATGFYMPAGDFGFAAVKAGYIYKTIDSGATWVAKESAAIAAGDYSCIHFADKFYGIAGGAADVIAMTDDGGETWAAATATGAAAVINCCWRLDKYRAWVGTANGRLYYTTDAGVTWTRRQGWVGDGVGAVKDIWFLNEMIGYMARNTAGPIGYILKTIDGGLNWKVMPYVTNIGLNRLSVVSQNFVMACGEPDATPLGVILKGVAANVP